MKSSLIAVASATVVAAAALVPRSPLLDLGANVDVDVLGIKAKLCLKVKIPEGIHMDEADCPTHERPADCIDMWHPAHDVTIDGCDNHGAHGWHYVHPCNCEDHAPHSWTTSTVTATHMVTTVNNVQTTYQVPATTTVCPVPVESAPATPYEQPPAPVQTPEYQPTMSSYQPTSIYTPTPVYQPSSAYVAPPMSSAPAYVAPSPAPYPTYTPSMVPAPAPAPAVPYAAPMGTAPGYSPRPYSNTTAPVVVGGAAVNSRNVGVVAVVVAAVALLL
ncbi:hypothetical protein CDD80_2754 [Ophiocordyceps camponoti-rufipedis]|uniref:Uncharacterized protein n=1 Tax=Ophiocordyceps camponoti-rufipedis TaxID=2004952 RepID=A0A2C5YA27_9HYPO|nr:hypothetical protein CDD80_2754 [Ophiocordyceps camponoti-rufipedis]